jgi:DNA (cytosine-5)-methyltransferase 1
VASNGKGATKSRTAEHRPPVKPRHFGHDEVLGVELFSGAGGLTWGLKAAGVTTIEAANHNLLKVEIHEANFPDAAHWLADLVNPDASDYHSAADLPRADFLAAGISCTNHSQSNTEKAYKRALGLFEIDDPEYEARVTRSERDRATATCVLQYAAKHHPRIILLECTTELTSWGPARQDKPNIGDGSTCRYWLAEFKKLNYEYRILYLNSMFFGVPQSRDRLYIAFWDRSLPEPDLDHRPEAWCERCDRVVQSKWNWKTGVPPSGSVRYGKQYHYTCPSCQRPVAPPTTPSLAALDLTDLGTRLGDRNPRLAKSTMDRAERCRQRFAEFPPIVIPSQAIRGTDQHPWQPAAQTSPPAAIALAIDNYQGAPRSAADPLPTQPASETLAVISSGVLPYRQNTIPTIYTEAMPTITAEQYPGLLTAATTITNTTGIDPGAQAMLFAGWSRDATASLTAQWHDALADLTVDDCLYRMMRPHEVGRGCGFDVDFPNHQGSFIIFGTPSQQIDAFGNAVSPAVGEWIGQRLRATLHRTEYPA